MLEKSVQKVIKAIEGITSKGEFRRNSLTDDVVAREMMLQNGVHSEFNLLDFGGSSGI